MSIPWDGPPSGVTLERHGAGDLDRLISGLISLYREAYADRLEDRFWSASRFEAFLQLSVMNPDWTIAVARRGEEVVGSMYGYPLFPGTPFWKNVDQPLSEAFTSEDGERTFTTLQLMVRNRYRGTGLAQAIHEGLLAGRPEARIAGSVEHGKQRLRAHYENWGYRYVGTKQPNLPGSPRIDLLVRAMQPHLPRPMTHAPAAP